MLRMVLEEQYARHHTQLALLARPDHPAAGTDTAAAVTAASRRALDDLACALRHLDQGRYGTCRRCRTDIPIEYLAHRPGARFCPRCDAASTPAVESGGGARRREPRLPGVGKTAGPA
ncbi:TraR/DksA family transcriptional regulator [Micromonospora sp. NPDC020750]|uniref:TraR/DksA family transcriptional regulator n=1 Tax=unclassified Micromonospora TaxID=2617518 RepID=UPI0037AEA219